jgi:transposase-like protein
MYKTHPAEEKAKLVLEALRGERTLNEIASEHNIHPNQLTKWKNEVIDTLPELFETENSKIRKQKKQYDQEIEALLKQVGKLSMQLEWAKKKSNYGILP